MAGIRNGQLDISPGAKPGSKGVSFSPTLVLESVIFRVPPSFSMACAALVQRFINTCCIWVGSAKSMPVLAVMWGSSRMVAGNEARRSS